MRLRASYTIENSYIIPLFTIVIVIMVLTGMELHDSAIVKAVCFQGNMKIEQEKLEGAERAESIKNVMEYIEKKTISVTTNDTLAGEVIKETEIESKDPRDFIRKRCRLNEVRAGE